MTEIQSALERIILELDCWCDNWTPYSYNDPRISLRQIADRARDILLEDKIYNLVKDFPYINTVELIRDTLKNDPKYGYIHTPVISRIIAYSGKFEIVGGRIATIAFDEF